LARVTPVGWRFGQGAILSWRANVGSLCAVHTPRGGDQASIQVVGVAVGATRTAQVPSAGVPIASLRASAEVILADRNIAAAALWTHRFTSPIYLVHVALLVDRQSVTVNRKLIRSR
jgi:hypothetical protein